VGQKQMEASSSSLIIIEMMEESRGEKSSYRYAEVGRRSTPDGTDARRGQHRLHGLNTVRQVTCVTFRTFRFIELPRLNLQDRGFRDPAFSCPAISSAIFHVLHFTSPAFSVALSWQIVIVIATARVHPVHLTNVARSARWPPTFGPSRSA